MSLKGPLRGALKGALPKTGTGGGAPPPPAFVPTDLSGLAQWVRADLGVTGTGVADAWADQSGNSRGFTSSGTNRPAIATVDGVAALTFDGSNDVMFTATGLALAISSTTIFMAMKWAANASGTKVWASLQDGSAFEAIALRDTVTGPVTTLFSQGSGNQGSASLTRLTTKAFVTGVLTASTSVVLTDSTGATITDATYGTPFTPLNRIFLGAVSTGGGTPIGGSIYEWGFYTRALSAGELTQLRDYLTARYA